MKDRRKDGMKEGRNLSPAEDLEKRKQGNMENERIKLRKEKK